MKHPRLSPHLVVDRDGNTTSVMLSLAEFERLLAHLEDLEDALALDEARLSAKGFVEYADLREQLRRAGRL